jgi:asparagine synthase (glutamine-hydrolysing)
MCGIAGVVSLGGGLQTDVEVAKRMASTLHHRGPDHLGAWMAPSGRCALGHSRLRVIDLSTGDQPVGNEDGTVQVILNGEIYNFGELRKELVELGHTFHTRSDTEVIAHGYESWGASVVERLEGMFSFALWDENAARLVLARDRTGKKPLYFQRSPRGVVFGSEMKAVLAHPQVSSQVDRGAIPLFLVYGYVPGAQTVYSEIAKLPPATVAVLEGDGSWEERQFWRARFSGRPERGAGRAPSAAEAIKGVRDRLGSAVGCRLESDVPLGAFLSGGVDSTAVVALMARASDRPVRTFSIGFKDHPRYDETAVARRSAALFGCDHTEHKVGPQSIDLVDRLVAHYDEPFGDSSAIPTYIVSRLAREHVTVALTGDGGDELFAGYLRFQGARVAESLPSWASRLGGVAARMIPHHADFRSLQRRTKRFLLAAASSPAERWLRWIGYLDLDLDRVLASSATPAQKSDLLASFRSAFSAAEGPDATSLSRALSVNFETYLPEDLLVKADRCSMAHGLELRSPFLDTALIEYAATLPDRMKIRGGTFKWVLKEAVRGLVPDEVLNRRKMGFGIPLPEWLRGPWRPLLEDRLLAPNARVREWIRPEALQALAGSHLNGSADNSHQLWALLTLDAWMNRQAEESRG